MKKDSKGGSILEDMEKLKQRREERKNKNDRGVVTKANDFVNMIKKKKQQMLINPENVFFFKIKIYLKFF